MRRGWQSRLEKIDELPNRELSLCPQRLGEYNVIAPLECGHEFYERERIQSETQLPNGTVGGDIPIAPGEDAGPEDLYHLALQRAPGHRATSSG